MFDQGCFKKQKNLEIKALIPYIHRHINADHLPVQLINISL